MIVTFDLIFKFHPLAVIHDTDNVAFKLAADFIQYSNASLFLTGKAGTGKTTFLKYIKEHSVKNMAIVAPTGVAAINAGGTTIHSFFQLPFTPFIPVNDNRADKDIVADKHSLLSRLRINSERKAVIQQLELLIIDEVSMVRCDVLDAIDTVLRHIRTQYNKPFGGVQVVLIGDLFQLPPVIKEEEWQLLSPYYKSPYFFNSHIIGLQQPVYIELEKIYRQSDTRFINLLNEVRNNELTQEGVALLESRYQPHFDAEAADRYITLSSHNETANQINFKKLKQLTGPLHRFEAAIEGDFPEKSFPAEATLGLKAGAQVMFIKNDTEKIRRYYNGKIGIVEKIETDKVWVRCADDQNLVEVKKEKWRNIRYQVDKKTNQVEEEEIGSFTQYPLRLAWAITIHKSQGLTFERAIIDAGGAFAPGQVYVALSRCISLEGIVLKTHINRQRLQTDARISTFIADQKKESATNEVLLRAKKYFQQDTILRLFDMSNAELQAELFVKWFGEHGHHFNTAAESWIKDIHERIAALNLVSKKFNAILESYFAEHGLPEQNETLTKRLQAAAQHYSTHIDYIKSLLIKPVAITDSRPAGSAGKEKIAALFDELDFTGHLLQSCNPSFSMESFIKAKSCYGKKNIVINIYSGQNSSFKNNGPNPELYRLLKNLRDDLCAEKDTPVYLVCITAALEEMAEYLPQTKEQLLLIHGFGKAKVQKYGDAFLSMIKDYCAAHNLESNDDVRPEKRIRKPKVNTLKTDTKAESLALYKTGKKINEIAIERKLSTGTIENHLSYYVGSGELNIRDFLSEEKERQILEAAKIFGVVSHKTIRDNLPAEITYGEIKMALAGIEKQL